MLNKLTMYCNTNNIKSNYKFLNQYGNIFFTLKTNSFPFILDQISNIESENDGFCISSLNDLNKLLDKKISPTKCISINVMFPIESLIKLYNFGVRKFTFDNFEKLKEFSKQVDIKTCEILLRINVNNIFRSKISYLGCNMFEFKKMYELALTAKKIGVGLYLQKIVQSSPNYVSRALRFINKICKSYNYISFFNVGGIKNDNDYKFLSKFKNNNKNIQVNIESGNKMLSNACDFETYVDEIKTIKSDNIIILHNGVFTGFFDVIYYKKKFDLILIKENRFYVLDKNKKIGFKKVLLFGNSGDSNDFIGDYYAPKNIKIEENDKILVKNVGAYFGEFFFDYGTDFDKNISFEVKNEI
jgi:diaminopimelate decarboxylase